MKKLIFSVLCIFIMHFMGCKNEDRLNIIAEPNLQAPSGVFIACDLNELREIAKTLIDPEITTSIKDIKILEINYLPVKSGFAATIEYSANGYESNFGYYDFPKVEYSALTLKSTQIPGGIQVQKVTVSCAGTCGCKVEGTIKPDGTMTFGCSCTECTATITYP